MRPLVDLEVLGPGKHFAAPGERTRERLLACMNTNMIHKFVLRLERPPVPGAALPEAGVCRTLRPTDVLHSQVGHDFVHRRKRLPARLPWNWLFGFDPHARHLLFNRLTHISEERPVVSCVVSWVVRCHAGDGVVVSCRRVHGRKLVMCGRLMIRVVLGRRAGIDIHAEPHVVIEMVIR